MRTSLLLIVSLLLLVSCSEYQRILKSDDAGLKYQHAESYYTNGKYKKALKLMEQIVPVYRGKPQAEKLMFMYANTFYQLEDYYLAGYQFERFVLSYGKSDSVEVAAYRSAESYYELSPRYSLDQEDTYKGLEKLQEFINAYPDSEYRDLANIKVMELSEKLQKKDIEVAKQYLKIGETSGTYKSAIEAFDNFILDHPGSKYRPDAYYGKFEAAYRLAINSFPSLVVERLQTSMKYYNDFKKYYPTNELHEEAKKILEDIDRRLTEKETSS
jgi:outer membrane protein assembly factor BamD